MQRKSEREHLLMLTQYLCANYVLHTFIQIHRRPDIWNVSKRLCIIFMSQFSFQSPPHFSFVLLVPISCRACIHTVRSKEANGVDECLIKSVMMIWWNGFFHFVLLYRQSFRWYFFSWVAWAASMNTNEREFVPSVEVNLLALI